uniref:Uncharacterized protein n=1 Tax=Arundo donax TaxID=35708 RepID=A0A0A9GAB9_ARUDO
MMVIALLGVVLVMTWSLLCEIEATAMLFMLAINPSSSIQIQRQTMMELSGIRWFHCLVTTEREELQL